MAKKDELNFENGNNMAGSEKLKALQAAMDKIEKSFGKGRTSRSNPYRFHRTERSIGCRRLPPRTYH